jgi:hypothetical protein
VCLKIETTQKKYFLFLICLVGAGVFTPLAPTPPPTAYAVLLSTATVPLARWLRWKLASATATWDVTMRIWASVNAPGG